MNKYNTYTQFPDIWISKIPAHWQAHKMKRLFVERSEKGHPNEPLLVASQKMGVVPKNVYGNRTVEAQKDLHLLKLVRIGDFVISLRSFQGGLEYAYYQGIISPAYTILIPHEPMSGLYFRYLAKSKPFIKLLTLCVTGIREGQNIDYTKLKNHLLPIPPRKEQDQIVRFLDWKVSSIHKLIDIKQKEIETLKEQRAALITQATHCGIIKPSKLKKSGFAWMDDIPVHWHIRSFSKVAVVRAKLVSPQEHLEDMQISPASIEKGSGRILYTQTVKEAGVVSNNHRFYKGQIIYSKIRPLLNKVAIAPFDGLCSTDMYPIETTLEIRYLKYFMLSQNFLCQLSMTGDRVKMPRLNQGELASVFIAFPEDKKEQKEIADYLDEVCEQIQASIECIKLYIATLRELSARLIADTVTGKIDVRNITVPEYECVEDTADDGREEKSEAKEGLYGEEE